MDNITENYKALAYVTVPASDNWRWIGADKPGEEVRSDLDTRYVTHINFAFGMIKAYQYDPLKYGRPLHKPAGGVVSPEAYYNPEDKNYHYRAVLNGWIEEMDSLVDGGRYLKALSALKKIKPSLKVLLSIGGWESDGFCYMARTRENRTEFIESCVELINEYNLDGIDIDWEYPDNGGYGHIASCENCVSDANALLKEFREVFDKEFPEGKLLTVATGCGNPFVSPEGFKALDFMNVMCYDFNPGNGGSQAGLRESAVHMLRHAAIIGDTPHNREKMNLGIPFYNEGGATLVPYRKPWEGHIDASPEITREKMEWVRKNGFGGGFYWAYSMDVFPEDKRTPQDPEIKILQRTLYETLNLNK